MNLFWLGVIGEYLYWKQQGDEFKANCAHERMEFIADQGCYLCPCCDRTAEGDAFYTICYWCGWECDGDDLDEEGGPNHITLREGRANVAKYGDSRVRCEHEAVAQWCRECEKIWAARELAQD